MVDTVGDLIDGLHSMRMRQALLIVALRKLGGELEITRANAYESAGFDIRTQPTPDGVRVTLKAAP